MLPRALKEIRPLAVPAAFVLAATCLSLLMLSGTDAAAAGRGWTVRVAMVAFYLGSALLVSLPYGVEFQQRTLALLLSQPEARARTWLRKLAIAAAVLAVLVVLQYAARSIGPFAGHPLDREARFLILMLCSAGFWTLLAGSTIGGVAFSLAALMMLELGTAFTAFRITGEPLHLFDTGPILDVFRVAYATGTLWLGWRLFARFEVRDDGAHAQVLAAAAPGVLRARPAGALRNLLRKELRLQQPAVLVAGLFAACWLAAIGVFSMVPGHPRTADTVFTVLLAVFVPLVLIVAGTISASEEAAYGTRAWHLTLPVTLRVQWLLKLVVTVIVASLLSIALPVALAAFASAAVELPGGGVQLPPAWPLLVPAIGVLVLLFWASTLFEGAVRTAVAAGSAAAGLAVCARAGVAAGWTAGTGPGSDFLTWIMVHQQLTPATFFLSGRSLLQVQQWGVTVVGVIAAIALAQSHAAFCRVQVERRTLVRYAGQLALAAFLGALLLTLYQGATVNQWRSAPVRELNAALEVVIRSKDDVSRTTIGELDATGLLSPAARIWLAGSEISLTPRTSTRRKPDGTRLTRRVHRARVVFPNGRVWETRLLGLEERN